VTEAGVCARRVGIVEFPRATECVDVRHRVVAGVLVPGVGTGITRLSDLHVGVRRVFDGVVVAGVSTSRTLPGGGRRE
jgi:hypothetical protein